jgi:hypothetical protein
MGVTGFSYSPFPEILTTLNPVLTLENSFEGHMFYHQRAFTVLLEELIFSIGRI